MRLSTDSSRTKNSIRKQSYYIEFKVRRVTIPVILLCDGCTLKESFDI